jgi:hypothetical protein
LHARSLDVCILNRDGDIVVPRNLKTKPDALLQIMVPEREDIVVAVACLFTAYWLADRCAPEGIPCGLGHALDRKAIAGGQAKHDTIDAQKIAGLRRGGRRPQAAVYAAEMRAPRALRRRRMSRMRPRAAPLPPVHQTNSR